MLSSRRARPASGAATARLGSKQRPRAWRAEAARAGRWWPWHDSNGVTLFAQQFDRGICCELLLYKYLVPGTWYLVGGTCGLRIVYIYKSIRSKRNDCFCVEPRIIFYTRTRKLKNEVTTCNGRGKKSPYLNLRVLHKKTA